MAGSDNYTHTHTHARTHTHTHTHTARQTALRWPWLLKLVNYLPAEYLQGSCKETAEEDEKSRYSDALEISEMWNCEKRIPSIARHSCVMWNVFPRLQDHFLEESNSVYVNITKNICCFRQRDNLSRENDLKRFITVGHHIHTNQINFLELLPCYCLLYWSDKRVFTLWLL